MAGGDDYAVVRKGAPAKRAMLHPHETPEYVNKFPILTSG